MRTRVLLLGASIAVGAGTATAQLDLGAEFQVNTNTAGDQAHPAVAVHESSEFTIVWQSGDRYGAPGGGDGSATGVFVQHFAADGSPVGAEQLANTFTESIQAYPAAAAQAGDAFVVAWESGCYYGGAACSHDGSRNGVALQRFDGSAAPAGDEQIVNAFTLGSQFDPTVAAGPTGEFVVAWTSSSYYYPTPGRDDNGVFAQRFDADGSPVASEFQANVTTANTQFQPDVAVDPAGRFVVVWREYYYLDRQYINRVWGRRFDETGAALGGQFEVSAGTTAGARRPAVATANDGTFVVVWSASGYDVKLGEVRGRRFAADGTPLGAELQVNTYTTGYQNDADVASDGAGNFVVTWESFGYYGPSQDGSLSGVFAQGFAHDGVPLGSEFQVNTYTPGNQGDAVIGGNDTGEFVVTWTSGPGYSVPGPLPQDGDGNGVFARRMALRPCTGPGECDDENLCTTDACEGEVCLNRRQAGCCVLTAECSDDDPCTTDACMDHACQHTTIPDCIACETTEDCGLPNACTIAHCEEQVCFFEPVPNCCTTGADCDDSQPCTEDVCTVNRQCVSTPIPDCVECTGDAECDTGCLLEPETCTDGRCVSPAGCPIVDIDDANPLGTNGALLVRIAIPEDVPGNGKVKSVVTAVVGTLEDGETPARRCRTGKRLGRVKATIDPGSETNLLLELDKKAVRCLEDDADGVLPFDVEVRVKRKKQVLVELPESRSWRR